MVSSIPDVIPPPAKGPLEAIDEVKKINNFSPGKIPIKNFHFLILLNKSDPIPHPLL